MKPDSADWSVQPIKDPQTGEQWVLHRTHMPVPDDDPLDIRVTEDQLDGSVDWEICSWNGGDMARGSAATIEQAKDRALAAVPSVLNEIAAFNTET